MPETHFNASDSNKPWVVIGINYQLWHPDKYKTAIKGNLCQSE